MKKMITTSSSLTSADSINCLPHLSELNASNEGASRFRCSAILSLAISMGASSFLIANPTKPAIAAGAPSVNAADVIPPDATSIEKNDSNPTLIVNQLISAIKHEVKSGETLLSLSQNYHTEPEAIAKLNNITPQTDLVVGQTLKIPTEQQSPRPEKISSAALDLSLNNLRESRRKLQESLAALRSNQIVEQPTIIAQTHTSEPIEPQGSSTPTAIDESSSLAIELNHPIPITVPTPETDVSQFSTSPTVISVPETSTTASVPILPLTPTNQTEQSIALKNPKLITPTSQETVYRVQPGDTLNTIAEAHGISVQALEEANRITDPNMIRVNQSLIIPGTGSENPSLTSSLPPVPSVKPVSSPTPVATTQINIPTVKPEQDSVPAKAIPLSVESVPQAQTEKIRSEFAQIDQVQTTPTQPTQVSIAIPVEANVPPANSVEQPEPVQATTIPVEANVTETAPSQPRNSEWDHDRSSIFRRSQQIEAKPPSEQPTIIGTATIPVEPYLDDLRIPVGTTVDPELPTPSNPNQYLPDTPRVFEGFIWPAKGVLSSGYGRRWGRMHRGIDIAAPVGTPVIAAASGEVISAGWNSGGYGNLVKLKHADGSITFYAHNSRLMVRKGQLIEQGQQIAQMGSTGFSTGPHLHFEIHPNGSGAVNPIAFLPGRERR